MFEIFDWLKIPQKSMKIKIFLKVIISTITQESVKTKKSDFFFSFDDTQGHFWTPPCSKIAKKPIFQWAIIPPRGTQKNFCWWLPPHFHGFRIIGSGFFRINVFCRGGLVSGSIGLEELWYQDILVSVFSSQGALVSCK